MALVPWMLAEQGALDADGGAYVADAITYLTIDSFEDEDIDEWLEDDDKDDFENFGSDGAVDGDVAMQPKDSASASIYTDGGLPNLPVEQGDTFGFWFQDDNEIEMLFRFGLQTLDEKYNLWISFDDDDFDLEVDDNGITVLDTANPTWPTSTPILIRIEWETNDDITVNAYTTAPEDGGSPFSTLSANDDTFTSGDIGFLISGGGSNVNTRIDWIHKVEGL